MAFIFQTPWAFALVALMSAAVQWRLQGYARVLLLLPSTLLHELAHYLVAYVTGSKPQPIDITPRRDEGGWQLGSVTFEPHPLTAALVALAPLSLLWLALWLWQGSPLRSLEGQAVSGYLFTCALQGAWPSREDWRVAMQHPIGLALLLGVLYLSLHAEQFL
jgi:hypothetical protein